MKYKRRTMIAVMALAASVASACGGEAAMGSGDTSAVPRVDRSAALNEKLPAAVRETGKLEIATDATYPPMEFFDTDGTTLIGFEVDLANALGQLLGVEMKWTNLSAASIIPGLEGGRFDLAATSGQDLPERREILTFIDYFEVGSSLLVEAGNPAGVSNLASLCGRPLGVQAGTAQLMYLESQDIGCPEGQDVQIRTFPTNDTAVTALRSGQIEAVFSQDNSNVYVAKQAAGQFETVGESYDPTPVGIVVKKGSPMTDVLLEAMSELTKSDVYSDIVEKWGLQDNVVDAVTINNGEG